MDGFLTISILVFTYIGSPVLAFFLSVLVSRHFENRKLAAEIALWTLLLPLFFIIGFVGFALSAWYNEDLAHHYPFNFDLLNTFSYVLRELFLYGLNFFNIALGAIWVFGILAFVSKEKERTN